MKRWKKPTPMSIGCAALAVGLGLIYGAPVAGAAGFAGVAHDIALAGAVFVVLGAMLTALCFLGVVD